MIQNERGFTYPFTFVLLLSFSLFLTLFCEQYIGEKRIYVASERIIKQEYYLLHAVKSVEKSLKENEQITGGSFSFRAGEIVYTIVERSEQLLEITFVGHLQTNEQWSGYGTYDKETEKMIKWVERK